MNQIVGIRIIYSGMLFIAALASQVLIYFTCVAGIRSIQIINLVVAPLLILLGILYLIYSLLMTGAVVGVYLDIYGDPFKTTFQENEQNYKYYTIWSSGTQSVFFSFFLGLGAYTAFGRHLKPTTPIINTTFGVVII